MTEMNWPDGVQIREMRAADGAEVWALIERAGTLDQNSPYLYLMLGRYFGDTCLVAERDGHMLGFTTGFVPPRDPQTVFLWQVGTDPQARGLGIGKLLVRALVEQPATASARFLETTVTPSNKPSRALFESFARSMNAPLRVLPGFPEALFPQHQPHETEELLRIGPLEREPEG